MLVLLKILMLTEKLIQKIDFLPCGNIQTLTFFFINNENTDV